ncbi:MAG TPA: molybdopterin cofactor-binding domain-containing protein [Hyphomonadaceae bacterium]|jgi:CO/xanthine dehydrogenase Mo-binding subunit|nr:molybdopterin cofactor-binding domain-containing protein [Hyphomonadaceae bacterium]
MDTPVTNLSRRGFLISTVGTGIAFSFLTACDTREASADTAKPFEPTQWYSMDGAGIVTVNVIRAEMGQHVGTSLARILADELEVPWENVRVKHVDSDPKWGLMVTGGSWSVWQTYPLYSQAGAAGRIALIEAGAKALGVDPASCKASNGEVVSGSKKIKYTAILAKGGLEKTYTPEELAKIAFKPVADRKLIGKPVMAVDIVEKTTGAAIYGIDAKVDGMVYGCPILPPTRNGSKVNSVDDSAAKAVKGYLQSVTLEDPSSTVPGWVMVIADSYPAAKKAAGLIKVKYTAGPTANVSEKDIQDHGSKLIADASKGSVLPTGNTNTAPVFKAAKSSIEATYTTATALHFQMEPVNALAFQKDGKWEIHTGNQWQSLVLPWLATALAVPETDVVMKTYRLGGGFGRRLNGDYAVGAALASKAIGKPVKMILTREADSTFDSVRSPSVQKLKMAFDKDGNVTGMEHHVAAGWPTEVMAPFFMPKGEKDVPFDPFAINGANHWYSVGAHKVRAVSNDLANKTFRPGWLRSVGPGFTNWALESFIDEAAHKQKMDPVEFRLKLLKAEGANAGTAPNSVGGASRQANVVKLAAQKAGWGGQLPAGTGLGLATSFGQERDMPTWVACVARVNVDKATGKVKVEKLTLVADAGTIVDPDGALSQMQGASLWGLSLALHEGTEFVKGNVKATNLGTYTPLRMADVPVLDISFVDSAEAPVGLGEPATTIVGPAIGNAIFNACGARLRHIPITADAVKKAMV